LKNQITEILYFSKLLRRSDVGALLVGLQVPWNPVNLDERRTWVTMIRIQRS